MVLRLFGVGAGCSVVGRGAIPCRLRVPGHLWSGRAVWRLPARALRRSRRVGAARSGCGVWHPGAVSTKKQPSADQPSIEQPHPGPSPEQVERLARLESLVGEWLTVPDVAERTGAPLTLVRSWLKEGELIAVRRGERNVISVPADFVDEHGPVAHLPGTLSVLRDARFDDDEAIEWLFTPDDTLRTGTPMSDILAGFKTEIRRRAQEMAF